MFEHFRTAWMLASAYYLRHVGLCWQAEEIHPHNLVIQFNQWPLVLCGFSPWSFSKRTHSERLYRRRHSRWGAFFMSDWM